jgi:8-oxo-dGTP pyrophosphatase MutT (NUDIX family)
MPTVNVTHVEVYLFRRRGARVEFLALRRSRDRVKLPGIWQPVTGKLDRGEGALAAAVREVHEETGLTPRRWWGLENATVYYDALTDRVLALPLFAAELRPSDRVRLSEEHDAFAFLGAAAAARRWLWNTQRRGLAAVRDQVLRGGAAARALELTDRIPGAPRRPPARRAQR